MHVSDEARLGVLVAQERLQKTERKTRENRHLHCFIFGIRTSISLIRVLHRLEALCILPGQTLKECEILVNSRNNADA